MIFASNKHASHKTQLETTIPVARVCRKFSKKFQYFFTHGHFTPFYGHFIRRPFVGDRFIVVKVFASSPKHHGHPARSGFPVREINVFLPLLFFSHTHTQFFYTSGVGLSLTNRRSHRKKILAPFSAWGRWFFCAPLPHGISKTNIWLGCMMYYGRSGVSVRFVVFIFYVTHIFVVCRVGNRSYTLFFLGHIFFCTATSRVFSWFRLIFFNNAVTHVSIE